MAGSLSAAEIARFEEHGYLHPKRAIGAEQAETYRALLDHYENVLGVEPQTYLKIKAHVAAPWIIELARSPAILDAVESLIGEDILLFGTSLFSKKGNDPRFVSWHQDSAYYGLDPHHEVTAWVALTPATRDNGCMRVIPGSHKGPDLEHDETYDPQNLLARGQTIRGLDEDSAAFMELEAGEFSLHHERTAHGSLANTTDAPRVGIAYFYMPAHCRSTIGRRSALLMRGEDRHGHWDQDPIPKEDLDPDCMAFLKDMWARYQDPQYAQEAARAGDG
jgi:ectoine hydroxylase-related dioxygenase (phytanoyl-CoA dioxygenase family)